jgi:hypothetical protein
MSVAAIDSRIARIASPEIIAGRRSFDANPREEAAWRDGSGPRL